MTAWFEESHWRLRLRAETALMKERFPDFALERTNTGDLSWRGILEPIGGEWFEITALTPANYPYAAPQLRVVRPELRPGSPHLYADGSLCVHKANWDPMRGTVASTIPLAAAWLVGYLNWARTGEGF